uniref:SERPIN domain-containing protein n=1 Tax=Steinernema glaseri TaxID=37863 RepID=A0A1I8AQS0_9BILA
MAPISLLLLAGMVISYASSSEAEKDTYNYSSTDYDDSFGPPECRFDESPEPELDDALFLLSVGLLKGERTTALSPLALAAALEVVALGSSAPLRNDFEKALHGNASIFDYLVQSLRFFDNTTSTSYKAAVFVDEKKGPLAPAFLQSLEELQSSVHRFAEGEARQSVSALFPELPEDVLEPSAEFAFASTLHSEGSFGDENLFLTIDTLPRPFFGLQGNRLVTSMLGESIAFEHFENPWMELAEIILDDCHLRLFFLMPQRNVTLPELKEHLLSDDSGFRFGRAPTTRRVLQFQMPKIDLFQELHRFKSPFASLGLTGAPDLARIQANPDGTTTRLADLVQTVNFLLDEKGVSADASSYYPSQRISWHQVDEVFAVDRPFLFGLSHGTLPLFVGQFY